MVMTMMSPKVFATTAILFSSLVVAQQQPNPCFRWSGQMAIANSPASTNSTSSLWYFGGQRKTSSDQSSNWWTNALVRLDLTKNWPTGTPSIELVNEDTGNIASPPAVSLGALWASADGSTLYQYGGQFQDNPSVSPPAQTVFEYSIASNKWSSIQTTGDKVTRPAEGMTTVVPGEGANGDNVGYYFGGHLDSYTVQGWSNQVPRVFLDSLVRFDLGNRAMTNLTSFSNSGSTSNSSSTSSVPVHRADGTLTFVPGAGTNGKGILVAIGGATDSQYVDNTVLDVYDIGSQGWTKQSTLGSTIGSRVNHCAVRASAKVNGELTHQIFVYGGQKLNQSDRDSAMYVLNIKGSDYTWKFVGDDLSGQPIGRAGHQCALQGDQMIVVGGVVASSILCDTPGIYVYNVSGSNWQNSYVANTAYSTPEIVKDLVGGIGTGGSSSGSGSATGGDGSQFADTSAGSSDQSGSDSNANGNGSGTSENGGGTGSGSDSGSSTPVGAIAGGAAGGAIILILLALLAFFLIRRKKKQNRHSPAGAPASSNGRMSLSGSDYSSAEERGLFEKSPYHHSSPQFGTAGVYTNDVRRGSQQASLLPASDDVEQETMNMDLSFSGAAFVPRQPLRVTNPSEM